MDRVKMANSGQTSVQNSQCTQADSFPGTISGKWYPLLFACGETWRTLHGQNSTHISHPLQRSGMR